jgi:hypothetical protein
MKRKCADCPESFKARNWCHVRCSACAVVRKQEWAKTYKSRRIYERNNPRIPMHCWCGVEYDGRTGHAMFCTPECAGKFRAVYGGRDLTHRAA